MAVGGRFSGKVVDLGGDVCWGLRVVKGRIDVTFSAEFVTKVPARKTSYKRFSSIRVIIAKEESSTSPYCFVYSYGYDPSPAYGFCIGINPV